MRSFIWKQVARPGGLPLHSLRLSQQSSSVFYRISSARPLDTNSDVQANQTASLTSPSPVLWTSSVPSGTKPVRCMWPESLQNDWYHHLRRTRGDVRTQRNKEKECVYVCTCVRVCSEVLLILGEICTSETWNSRHTWSWGEQCFLELLMSTGTKPRDPHSWFGLGFVVLHKRILSYTWKTQVNGLKFHPFWCWEG